MTKSQKGAGIRIPAPTLTIIHVIMAILLGWRLQLPIPTPRFVGWIGLGLAALGFVLGVLAMVEFRRARASSNPKKPNKVLVTSGVYRFTRNPIYLGFVLILIGLPLTMGNYWGIVLVLPLVTFMKNMVIQHEEAYLEKEFKNEFAEYCSRVRRWL
ncbi:MAG: isoprenylcysteine carboxylmethyltransferase family protein [Chloroflexi bacterium]|nr:isoprenylcysteine carboxylmethyltransferase family protein [Chloroflexota bacterium]